MGMSRTGELFASVTTSNYPFSYVDSKYNVCNSNTIYLKTNLNNIAVASNPVFCSNPVFVLPEPSLTDGMGGLQGVMPTGNFELRQLVVQGFDGQVLVHGYRDLLSEESVLLAAFTRYLRTDVYPLQGHKNPVQEKNLNLIDFDVLDRFSKEITDHGKQTEIFDAFKGKFIPSQIAHYGIMASAENFLKAVKSLEC